MKNIANKTCTHSRPSHTDWSFELWQKKALFLCKRGNLESELLLQSYIHSLKEPLPIDNEEEIIKNKTKLIDQLLLETEQNLFHWLLNVQNSTTTPVKPIPSHSSLLIKEIRDNYLN